MKTRDCPTLHKLQYRNNTFIAVRHFTVTTESSTMRITHTLKWVRSKHVKRPLTCGWAVLFTFVDKHYIYISQSQHSLQQW